MIAVIFEVWPADGRKQTYLDIAARAEARARADRRLPRIERFQSLTDDSKILSLSFWRDEAAVKAWRNVEHHRAGPEGRPRGRVPRLSPARRLRGARLRHDRTRRGAAGFARKERVRTSKPRANEGGKALN